VNILCRPSLGHTTPRRKSPDSRRRSKPSRRVNKFKLAEFEPSAHLSRLCHAEQSFARSSPICYPDTLRRFHYPNSCIIHLSEVPQNFLNTYRAGSSFLFLDIAFCDQRSLYSKSSTPSFFNRTSGKCFHRIHILGSQWV
jgi:hypothetical protein